MMQMHQAAGQQVRARIGREIVVRELPAPGDEVMPGVQWGRFDVFFTPAFWAGRVWLSMIDGEQRTHRLGHSLREEIAACLLGGFGIPAEVGLAAFTRMRQRGLLDRQPTAAELLAALREPLCIGDRSVRYRFATQKATYLAEALRQANTIAQPADDLAFRDHLAEMPGIGLKTASWITRNVRDSDAVAILDVHVCRACEIAGVFEPGVKVARAYRQLEAQYLAFAKAIGVRASLLDSIMWETMRRLSRWVPRHVVQAD